MTDDRETPTPAEDDHPLASPTELAGSTEGAIDAEFAARDLEEAIADAGLENEKPTDEAPPGD